MAAETMEYGIKSFNSQIKEECLDTSKLKDKVFFSLINAEQNRELLNTVPHREYEDFNCVVLLFSRAWGCSFPYNQYG